MTTTKNIHFYSFEKSRPKRKVNKMKKKNKFERNEQFSNQINEFLILDGPRYKTKRRQQQELGALVNSGNARRVAVRVLVHPDEHLRGLPLRGSGQLPGQMSAPQIHPANKALGGFPYYCLPYHPLLCPPLHSTHIQVQNTIAPDLDPSQLAKLNDEK